MPGLTKRSFFPLPELQPVVAGNTSVLRPNRGRRVHTAAWARHRAGGAARRAGGARPQQPHAAVPHRPGGAVPVVTRRPDTVSFFFPVDSFSISFLCAQF